MTSNIVIASDEYIGVIRLNTTWRFFYEVMSMWILDYASYDPYYDPSDPKYNQWRKELLVVDVKNAAEYCASMKGKELTPSQIPLMRTEFGTSAKKTFVVDFDKRLYVSGWHDSIALHKYVPSSWRGVEDDPYNYVPPEIKKLWGK